MSKHRIIAAIFAVPLLSGAAIVITAVASDGAHGEMILACAVITLIAAFEGFAAAATVPALRHVQPARLTHPSIGCGSFNDLHRIAESMLGKMRRQVDI
jgi:exosortase/archaeosortase